MDAMTSKVCKMCNEVKPASEFYLLKSRGYGPYLLTYCKACTSLIRRQYREDNVDKLKTYRSRPDRKARQAALGRMETLRKYDLTEERYQRLYDSQQGQCPICKTKLQYRSRTTHIDHDHRTRQVRGLLCNNCNNGLGRFKDDPIRLLAAAKYLS